MGKFGYIIFYNTELMKSVMHCVILLLVQPLHLKANIANKQTRVQQIKIS